MQWLFARNFLNPFPSRSLRCRLSSCPTVSVPRMPSTTLPPPRLDQGPTRPYRCHSTPARVNGIAIRLAAPSSNVFPATSHTMFAVVGGTGPARPAVSHKAAVRQPLLPRKLRWGVGAAPAVTSWPMELLCERSALSPRPEPAIDGDLMKALMYRSPFDATLGLCGWRSLLTAAGLCARKTTVRGWVALEREGRRKV